MGRLQGLKAREVFAALRKAGFELIRQKGSHMVLGHPDRPELRVTVPDHGRHDLKTGTVRHILKQAGLTPEEFIDLL